MPKISESDWPKTLKRIILIGYGTLIGSGLFLYLSADSEFTSATAITMVLSRALGIVSFFIGALAIFNRHWNSGGVLFVGSIILPVVSLYFQGFL